MKKILLGLALGLIIGASPAVAIVVDTWRHVYSEPGFDIWCSPAEKVKSDEGKPVLRYWCWIEEEVEEA